MKKSTVILFAVALSSCSPKVITSFEKTYDPILDSPDEVVVIENPGLQAVSSNTELLGTVRITDTGLTLANRGTYEKVVDLSKEQAWQAGGNLLVIKEHNKPDFKSTIHRINSFVYRADSSFLNTAQKFVGNKNSYITPSQPAQTAQAVAENRKPVFVAGASVGVGFKTNRIADELTTFYKDHIRKLKVGLDLGLDINYIFKSGNGIGLVYNRYSAKAQDYGLYQDETHSETGYLNTTLDIDFIGLLYSLRFVSGDQKHTFMGQAGLGPVFYDSKDTFNSLSDHMTGSTAGVYYSFIYGYNVTDHFSLGAQIKYMTASLLKMTHTDQDGVITVQDFTEDNVAEGLNTLGLFCTARYTF